MSEEKIEFTVVCYMRIDPEEVVPLTYTEALDELAHRRFLQPENIYRIEPIGSDSEFEDYVVS